MRILRFIYGLWCSLIVLSFYLLTYPFSWLFLLSKKTYPAAHYMNRVWGVLVHFFTGLLIIRTGYSHVKNIKGPVIYVANHTSYLDISSSFLAVPGYFSIIGKAVLGKVPMFGPMFSKMYITVDRRSKESRLESYKKSGKTIDEGRSLFFFPEGTIPTSDAPQMIKFKDGAFKLAIEKQIPVVPISIPYNWIVLPDSDFLNPRWHLLKFCFHEPIETKGMTDKDLNALKDKAYNIIDTSIKKHNKL
jgi:1-acyl-sn-glycerol-3-phosphate acyltransferase